MSATANRAVLVAANWAIAFVASAASAAEPDVSPTGTAGALKSRVETGGGYDPYSGNASRSITDLVVPGAVGEQGLTFTRHWNSTATGWNGDNFLSAAPPGACPFGGGGWTHNWNWVAVRDIEETDGQDGTPCAGRRFVRHIMWITFPDGQTRQYSYQINDCDPGWQQIVGTGSLLEPEHYRSNWGSAGTGVADYLQDMADNGSSFWLYLGDGSSVFFERVPLIGPYGYPWGVYRATKVIDSYGLATLLRYDDSRFGQTGLPEPFRLDHVEEPAGRRLKFTWGHTNDWGTDVLVRVESMASESGPVVQAVQFGYGIHALNGGTTGTEPRWAALDEVVYPQTIASGPEAPNPVAASYVYETSNNFIAGQAPGPVLTHADDPRFEGPMTQIKYDYVRFPYTRKTRPQYTYGMSEVDFFYPSPTAITAERSGATGQLVSALSIESFSGKRVETRGAGGMRTFFYGQAGGPEPGGYFVNQPNGNGYWVPPEANTSYSGHANDPGWVMAPNRGYELVKVTDFTNGLATTDFQHFLYGYPWRIFDAKGTLTVVEWNPAGGYPLQEDGNGRADKVRRVGAGEGLVIYNWTAAPAGTAPQNFTLLPNPWKHWLFSQTDENTTTTTYIRDSLRRIVRIDHPGGTWEEFQYNAFNQVTAHRLANGAWEYAQYDGRGLLLSESNSVDGEIARKQYAYDNLDRVYEMQEGRARAAGVSFTVRLFYNGRHQVVREEYPGTGARAVPSKAYLYDRYGNCTGIKNEEDQWSYYEYDAYRRCTSYTEPLNAENWNNTGTIASRTWNWYYDRWYPTGLVDASAHISNQWRIQIRPAFNGAGDRPLMSRLYDYNERMTAEATGWIATIAGNQDPGPDAASHSFAYDVNGNKTGYIDPQGRPTTYQYDLRDRLKKTIEPDNLETENWYDWVGNKTMVQFPGPSGNRPTTRWEAFDAFGQPGRFIDERSNTTHLYYQWGPMKKLQWVITHRSKDGGGTEDQATNFYYDGMGRPQWTIFPDNSSEFTGYQFGQANVFKTRKDQFKTVFFDARGRETYHTWNGDAAPRIDCKWDDANRLTEIKNNASTIEYASDGAGQVRQETNTIVGSGGAAATLFYRYPDGRTAHRVSPAGYSVRHDYTARGQLKKVGWGPSGSSPWQGVNYNYFADGTVNYQTYGNNVTTAFGYDNRGDINAVDHKRTSNQWRLSYREYFRDQRRRIWAWRKSTDTILNPRENGKGDRYQYDAEGQLVNAWSEAADPLGVAAPAERPSHFIYDELGNRRDSNHLPGRGWTGFTRDNNCLNQYSHWSPSIITHDDDFGPAGNGVLMQEGGVTVLYNALNQATTVFTAQGSPMNFGYDPLGRCVKRWFGSNPSPTVSGPATYFYYDGWNLMQEGPGPTSPTRTYVPGGRVDEIVYQFVHASGAHLYQHYDARGHCTLLTDASGNLLEQYEYDAFGKPYVFGPFGGALGDTSAWGNRFLFTGREWLTELKLYDYRYRLYHPELGRFLQPDPKQFEAGDYNLYRYCHNDPINKVDPMGLGYEEAMTPVDSATREAIAGLVGSAASAVAQHVSNNREIYFGAAMVAAEAYRSKGHSSGMRSSTGYRYVGKAEAAVIKKTGEIPKVDAAGKPKPVFFTNERFTNPAKAKKSLSLPRKPEFRVEFSMKQAPAGYGGVADGGGAEFTLRETAPPIPALRIIPLDHGR